MPSQKKLNKIDFFKKIFNIKYLTGINN